MDKFFTYDNCRLHYTDRGEGQPVLLLHGWGCNCTTFGAAQAWLEANFRVISVDFAGFGTSEEPQQIWGVEQYTRSIEALAANENITKPILIGHSFGGRVSIVYASRNDVCKVILVDAAGVKPKRSLNYYVKVYSFKLMKWAAPILLGKKRGQELINSRRAKAGSADYNNASPTMRAILSKVVNEDLCHLMPKIKVPTLLFWGENDTATPLSNAKKMERLIPDAGLVTVTGAGHFSFLENMPLFLRVMESFLSKEIKR